MDVNRYVPYVKVLYAQFLYALHTLPEAVRFFRQHRLWEGFLRYGWVAKILMVVGVLASLQVLGGLLKVFGNIDTSNAMSIVSTASVNFGDFAKNQLQFFTDGGARYVILVLLEILVFHVCHRTVDILMTDRVHKPTLHDFIKAQVRMFVVAIVYLVIESLVSIPITIFFKIVSPLAMFKDAVLLVVHCVFLGMMVMDNYNEIFGLKIKESLRESRQYLGIALALGLVLRLFFLIPGIGPVIGTLLTGVAASMILHENSTLHLRGREDMAGVWEEELV
jgi:uncharacterized protein YqgC (DUF456 family)